MSSAKLPKVGDTVQVTGQMRMGKDNDKIDPSAVPVGTKGKVLSANPIQIGVKWENGQTLFLLPEDPFVVI